MEAAHAPALGAAPALHPFGDLVSLQQLSVRVARGLKGVFEPLLRAELGSFAEPITVERWSDYREARGKALSAWYPLEISAPKGRGVLVLDGGFVLRMLDLFFGGEGDTPSPLPPMFTPAAQALLERLAVALCPVLAAAWEPLAPLGFRAQPPIAGCHLTPEASADEAVIVTRFGLAVGDGKPAWLDLLYPVSVLKAHGDALATKVHAKPVEVEPKWRTGLTRAVMGVRLPVRSVLAEPTVPLSMLVALKPGDIIPIEFGAQVPVMVGKQRLGTGTAGSANGRAAIKLTQIEPLNQEDFR